jgi:hypothetical protein
MQRVGFCASTDGVRVAYGVHGQGPPLVKAANWLTHLEQDWESPVWRHWLDALGERHTVIRYGAGGGSDVPSTPGADAPDSLGPTVTLRAPARRLRGRRSAWRTLRGTVSDAQPSSGIRRVEVSAFRSARSGRLIALDGRRFRTVERRAGLRTFTRAKLSGGRWSLRLPALKPGRWTFRARAIDRAGHRSKLVQRRVTLR